MKGETNGTSPKENDELMHISQIPIYIGGKKMTLQEIQEKARKEKENEKIRKD